MEIVEIQGKIFGDGTEMRGFSRAKHHLLGSNKKNQNLCHQTHFLGWQY